VNPRAKHIHTHPLWETRIKELQALSGRVDPNANKRFQVDSALFFKIRTRANDECIYLNFANKEYFNCLYDSYKEFVKDPDDQFYSFFVLESLRRLLVADKSIENKNFITSEFYVPLKDIKEKPKVNTSIVQSEFARSIFYNYDLLYPFNTELSNVKSKYTSNDTLEFVTNKEAYEHLYKYLNARCKICNYTYMIADPNTLIDVGNFDLTDVFQKNLFNELKDRKTYNSSSYTGRKVPIFLNHVAVYEGSIQYNQLTVSVASHVKEMFNDKMASTQSSFDHLFYQKLNFCDLDNLRWGIYFSNVQYANLKEKKEGKNVKINFFKEKYVVPLDFGSLMPDQFGLASRYLFNKLIWVNIYSRTKAATVNYIITREKTSYFATIYCMDLTNNTISCMSTTEHEKIEFGSVFSNRITLDEFKTEHAQVFEGLFNEIIVQADFLIKN
jgi:hypothetical protein